MELIIPDTRMRKCFGQDGYASRCCRLEKRDYIIAPIGPADARSLFDRLAARFEQPVAYETVCIDFEEGAKLFPERAIWRNSGNYPAMRPVTTNDEINYHCQFPGNSGECKVYDVRPSLCRNYRCQQLASVLSLL